MKPYEQKYMTWVVMNEDGSHPFNPILEANGKPAKIVSASVYNENHVSQRLTLLLRTIIEENDHVDAKFLNEIGFSMEDANYLGIFITGIKNINVPPNWEDDL
ncbi:hypothetical protein [Enterovibrio sp. 27052020O]|uniref:hypothetical protein n=1 Tax=Enterovibrio sp. 27052020O TaxID=3241166 RepID=UPI00388FF466